MVQDAERQDKKQDFALNTHATLMIGLGGAGGQILARVKKLVNEMYGDRDDIRRLVQYLVFDADQYASLDPITRSQIDERSEFFLFSDLNPFETYRHIVGAQNPMVEDLSRWMPPFDDFQPYLRPGRVIDGASRTRPLGRFYLYWHRNAVEAILQKKIDACFALGAEGAVDTRGLRVLICASCCGGSGSSTFFDIVYMLQRILREKTRDLSIEAYIPLPEPFVRAAKEHSKGLENYLRANAFGFFRELDYITKKPDAMNAMAFDYVTKSRHTPSPAGGGLPEMIGVPVRFSFLVDAEVETGGVGMFPKPQDIFDFTARQIAWSQFEQNVLNGIKSTISNIEAMAALDREHQRPKRYGAIGFAELAYPTDLVADYFTRRATKLGIDALILGESYPKDGETKGEFARAIVAEVHDRIFKPLDIALEKIVEEQLATLTPLGAFTDRKKRPDRDRISVESLNDALTSAKTTRSEGILRIDQAVHGALADSLEVFGSILRSRVNSLMNGFGLRALYSVFESVNNTLEKALEAWNDEKIELDKSAARTVEEAFGGSDVNPPVINEILKFKKDAGSKLTAYINGVDAYAKNALDSRILELKCDLLSRMVGAVGGSDPVPFEFSTARGQFVPGTRPEKSLIDETRARVGDAITFFDRRAREIRPEIETRKNEEVAGRSPTTRYLPAYFNNPNWDEHPDVLRRFETFFPYLASGNTASRAQDRAKAVLTLLEKNEDELGWRVSAHINETQELAHLEDRLRGFARTSTKDGLRVNILDLLKAEPDVEALKKFLHDSSKVAFRIDKSRFTNELDNREVATLDFFGTPDAKKSKAFAPDGGRVFATPPDRLIVLRAMGILPIWVSKTLAAQESAYAQREPNNFPHIVHRFNLGQLEIDDRWGASTADPLDVFLKMYALSKWLDADKANAARLGTFLEFDSMPLRTKRAMDPNWKPGFIFRERAANGGMRTYGLLWEVSRGEDFVVRLAPGRVIPISDPAIDRGLIDNAVWQYRKTTSLFDQHAEFASKLVSSEEGQSILREAAAAMIEICTTQYEMLLSKIEAGPPIGLREFRKEREIDKANLDFLGRAINLMNQIIPNPDPTPMAF
ncbi:MAG: hypothetical protein IT350_15275 [Deltaproteobacteria bacterium]|nr:hypothetical protein [Deltaproteobacteria bacterium]